MPLIVGTAEGVYRGEDAAFDDAERLLDAGRVRSVEASLDGSSVYAATETGLYRSVDGGSEWDRFHLPHESVWSVLETGDGTLYAGTAPAHLYRSADEGESWTEVETLQRQPSRDAWTSPVSDDARLRALASHPAAPDQLVVGIEAGKLHVSEDAGATWREIDEPIPHDVHHVLVPEPDEFVVSTGFLGLDGGAPGGLYRTTDGGASWTRLDTDTDRSYFREAIQHDGRLYAAAARNSPGYWSDGEADAALYERDDRGSLRAVPYPGEPEEVIVAWAVADGTVVAGTTAGGDGRVIHRSEEGWAESGRVPAGVYSLAWL